MAIVYQLLQKEGFARLPRRSTKEKSQLELPKIKALIAATLDWISYEKFYSRSIGILALLPYIKKYNIDKAIKGSGYPETKSIKKLLSILSFVALKLSDVKRYCTKPQKK